MEKRKPTVKFLKNRMWKSKIAHRLKGRVEDICQDFHFGIIDRDKPRHVIRDSQLWIRKFLTQKKGLNKGALG